MASVSSLDQDMRNLRMSRYTPAAASEARTWIESTLGRSLPPGDLLDALKDGVALCELANLVLGPPGIKYKQSSMPFIQMENISHFLTACEMRPLSLPAHDRFLTVDLYENKDPAQVLQCLGAFSRQAHTAKPNVFRTTIGPKKTGQAISPANTGGAPANGASRFDSAGNKSASIRPSATMPSTRAMSPSLTGGSQSSQTSAGGTVRSPGPVSSWSKKSDEGVTAPAWNIHQYGYLGGANQGSQGVSFGARRQITTAAPQVPSLAEKERIRKEKAEEEERAKQRAAREERDRQVRLQQEEEEAKAEEERQWEEETKRHREDERLRIEEQKRKWGEDERRWKEEEEAKQKEAAKLAKPRPPEKPRVPSSDILRGQSLSQYQKEQAAMGQDAKDGSETPEQRRVRELEKQLEEARERERQYQAEREERLRKGGDQANSTSDTTVFNTSTDKPPSAGQSEGSWAGDEREYLRKAWQSGRDGNAQQQGTSRPLPVPQDNRSGPSLPARPLPQPTTNEDEPAVDAVPKTAVDGPPSLPQRTDAHSPQERRSNRTDDYLSSNAPPREVTPRISASNEAGDASLEQQRDRDRRVASQQKTQAGGWASKSLLEREMEKERERQREWEEAQKALKSASRDTSQGTGQGQSWDVNQYGYMGGDSQNKGSSTGSGIAFGGRRQIIGPRPQK